jgi:hypothetical protein
MDDGLRSDALHSADAPLKRVPRAASKLSAFASLRFDGIVPLEAAKLAAGMAKRGASLEIINMVGGGDIDAAVINGIEHCDTFIVFGSMKYGEDTGNAACTYYESKYAQDQKKRIILIRMIPFEEQFEFPQARFMFGLNKLVIPWMLGTPMPANLVDQILEAMDQAPLAPTLSSSASRGASTATMDQAPLAPTLSSSASAAAWPTELVELVSIASFAACLAELDVHSMADFADCIDVDEGHGEQLRAVLEALPSKPRKNKVLRNRALASLADLMQWLSIFIEYDSEEKASLSRADCLRIPAEMMQAKAGGCISERFDDIDADKDGRITFQEMFEHMELTAGEGTPPAQAAASESAPVAQSASAPTGGLESTTTTAAPAPAPAAAAAPTMDLSGMSAPTSGAPAAALVPTEVSEVATYTVELPKTSSGFVSLVCVYLCVPLLYTIQYMHTCWSFLRSALSLALDLPIVHPCYCPCSTGD